MKTSKTPGYVLAVVLIAGIWKGLSLLINSPVLPPPEAAFTALARAIETSVFWGHFGESAYRVVVSLAVGLAIAFPLGIAMGYNAKLDKVLAPMLFLTYPIPKIVFLPLIFVLFGLGNFSKIVLITAVVGYQLLVVIRDGVANINRKHVETVRSLGGKQADVVRHVLVPAAWPATFTGLRLTTGTAITVLFLAETYATNQGLGYYIVNSWSRAAYDELFVGIIGMSLLGIILYGIFSSLEKSVCHWKMLENVRTEADRAVAGDDDKKGPVRWRKALAWYRASRPFTLSAALAPVLVGSALAFRDGQANLVIFVLVVAASLLVQITANLVDEYSDHARPEGRNKLPAPHKVIARGVLSPKEVKLGAAACAGAAGAIGLYLVIITGWPLLVVCLFSLAAAYFHSAGPRPLGSVALGHPIVFLFMGPVMVVGSYYVQTHVFSMDALWLSIPVACSVTAILVANDLRDLEEDKAAGKTTFVTLWGRGLGRWEWIMLLAVAFLIPLALVAVGRLNLLVLLPLLALPQAIRALRAIWRGKVREDFVPVLQLSSSLHGYLGILLAAGVGLGWVGLL